MSKHNLRYHSNLETPDAYKDSTASLYTLLLTQPFTYDHRILTPALPVRSAVLKQDTGGLVVRWVTTSESPLLYVFEVLVRGFFCMWSGRTYCRTPFKVYVSVYIIALSIEDTANTSRAGLPHGYSCIRLRC